MAFLLTPEDLMDEYYELDVTLDHGPGTTVMIDHYKNNDDKNPILKDHHKTVKARAKLYEIQQAIKKDPNKGFIDGEPVNDYALRLTFVGKGSPDDIRATLRLADRYDLVTKDRRKITLQDFCNEYIGLDCNGFVANYVLLRGQKQFGTRRGDIGISVFDRHRRKNARDIMANDVLIWTNIHIAIINEVFRTGSTVELDVVESHPFKYYPPLDPGHYGGLRMSRYQFVRVKNNTGLIEVKGGPSTGMPNVHIADVGLAWAWDKANHFVQKVAAAATAG